MENPTTTNYHEQDNEKTRSTSEQADLSSSETTSTYGVDVSFPIFHSVSSNFAWLPHNQEGRRREGHKNQGNSSFETPIGQRNKPLQPLGDRQHMYNEHLAACRSYYPKEPHNCDLNEYNRMLMNLRQPSSMVNYTETGFQLIQAPKTLVEVISKFWKQNHYKGMQEQWPVASTHVNYWEAPTYLISVDDKGLRGSGPELKKQIWEASAAVLEEWTSQELQPCSLYGIRVYGTGAIMLPHVDRLPLVASAIIPVAQDLEEPWPLEVYNHDGKAHNITMKPGEMLLFESHSVIHGHPFPLKGEFAAYLFVHFEPTGSSLHQDAAGIYRKGASVDDHYKASVQNGVGGQSSSHDGLELPPYIQRHSAEELNWISYHPQGWNPPDKILPSNAHLAAKTGNLAKLVEELDSYLSEPSDDGAESVLTQRDENGWQVLHQGVASGSKEVVELLVERGASINSRTHGGYGETPLRIAEKWLGLQHPVVKYLKGLGALSLGPDL